MSELRFWLSAVLIGFGIACDFFAIFGVYKFRFVMNRMHCAAILDTLSMAGILVGLMVMVHSWDYVPKLLAALVVLWVSSPIASHLVGRMEIDTDETAKKHIKQQEDANESH